MPTPSPKELLDLLRQDFDPVYYRKANRDVTDVGMDPLAHFILSGMAEGRAPSARRNASDTMQKLATTLGQLPDRILFESIHRELITSTSLFKMLKNRIGSSLPILRGGRAKKTSTDRSPRILFDLLDLSVLNTFSGDGPTFTTKKPAIKYLLDDGYKQLLPVNFHLVPDIRFVRALYPEYRDLDDAEAYRWWLRNGVQLGHFISEPHALNHFGARTTHCMDCFPVEAYLVAYRDLPFDWSDERLFLHFLNDGVPEARFSFKIPADLVAVIEDMIEALARTDPFKARHAAQRLILAGHRTPGLSIIAARAALSNDDLLEAQQLLADQTSDVPIEQFWIENLSAQAAKRAEMNDVANVHMRKAREIEYSSMRAESEYQSFLKMSFESSCNRAQRLSDLGKTEQAVDILERAVSDVYSDLQPYGFSVAPEPMPTYCAPLEKRPLRIGMLCDMFLPQCKLYRVDQKIEQLKLAGVIVESFDFRTHIDEAMDQAGMFDAWIIYRVPAMFDCLRLVRCVNDLGRPTIYEIDDLLFDSEHYPEPLSAFGGNISEQEYRGLQLSTPLTAGMARVCSHGIASTETLATEMAKLVDTGQVIVHHNALSSPHYAAIDAHQKNPSGHDPSVVRIFYGSGTKAHKDFLEDVFFSALNEVMSQRLNVEFHAIGYVNAEQLKAKHGSRIFEREPIWEIAAYWSELAKADINTAILKKSLLTDAKSEIKWMEAGMLGIPSVVSGTATLTDVIDDGSTGLIATTCEEWVSHLLRLIDDAELRKSIGANAEADILERYSLEKMSTDLVTRLTDLVHPTFSTGREC